MAHPPRLAHLATRAVLIEKLIPTYAAAHQLEDDEARDRLQMAFRPPVVARVLDAIWEALLDGPKRLTDEVVVEKVAHSLKDRPLRPGRKAPDTPGWSAFMLMLDVEAGTASESARRVLETDAGQKAARAGLAEAAKHLAAELTRKP